MAMPRPKGKALKIAKVTVPGLRTGKDHSGELPYRAKEDVETIYMQINANRGKLPKRGGK